MMKPKNGILKIKQFLIPGRVQGEIKTPVIPLNEIDPHSFLLSASEMTSLKALYQELLADPDFGFRYGFQKPPENREIFLASQGRKNPTIIGMVCRFKITEERDGQDRRISILSDWIVGRNFRREGVARRLLECIVATSQAETRAEKSRALKLPKLPRETFCVYLPAGLYAANTCLVNLGFEYAPGPDSFLFECPCE